MQNAFDLQDVIRFFTTDSLEIEWQYEYSLFLPFFVPDSRIRTSSPCTSHGTLIQLILSLLFYLLDVRAHETIDDAIK